VRADANVLVPELLPRASSFLAVPAPVGGTNLFYIRQTTYRQQSGRAPTLTLLLDQVADFAAADLTRMRYEEQLRQRSKRTALPVQPVGLTLRGFCGGSGYAPAASGTISGVVTFPAQLAQVPTGLTFTTSRSTNMSGTPTVSDITPFGCRIRWSATAAGYSEWFGIYQTVGN
jgi:hypothetical protein